MNLVPLFDLKFLVEFAATAVGTSNRRHWARGDERLTLPRNSLFAVNGRFIFRMENAAKIKSERAAFHGLSAIARNGSRVQRPRRHDGARHRPRSGAGHSRPAGDSGGDQRLRRVLYDRRRRLGPGASRAGFAGDRQRAADCAGALLRRPLLPVAGTASRLRPSRSRAAGRPACAASGAQLLPRMGRRVAEPARHHRPAGLSAGGHRRAHDRVESIVAGGALVVDANHQSPGGQ